MKTDLLSELGRSLVTGSLNDEAVLAETAGPEAVRILPNANVIKVGGQSFIDRGGRRSSR